MKSKEKTLRTVKRVSNPYYSKSRRKEGLMLIDDG